MTVVISGPEKPLITLNPKLVRIVTPMARTILYIYISTLWYHRPKGIPPTRIALWSEQPSRAGSSWCARLHPHLPHPGPSHTSGNPGENASAYEMGSMNPPSSVRTQLGSSVLLQYARAGLSKI